MLGKRRSKAEQSKHDKAVRSIARSYQRKGWKVKADIPGFTKPKPIGKYKRVPDIVATRRGATHIVEVETRGTYRTDKDQRSTFKRSASHRKRTKFIEKTV